MSSHNILSEEKYMEQRAALSPSKKTHTLAPTSKHPHEPKSLIVLL